MNLVKNYVNILSNLIIIFRVQGVIKRYAAEIPVSTDTNSWS